MAATAFQSGRRDSRSPQGDPVIAVSPRIELLRPKLTVPQLSSRWLIRPRLVALLEEGAEKRILLISAPAGFGKTGLLAEWLATRAGEIPVAWLTLDERDNDPARLGGYLAAALSALGIRLAPPANGPDGSEVDYLEDLMTQVINQASQLDQDFWLVLDDFHRLAAPAVFAAFAFLLEHQPTALHLVISTRTDPALTLGQLRAQFQLAEIRADELRLSPEEVRVFLNNLMGLNLSPEEIALLDAHTEGWVAGLQLAALSIRERRDLAHSIRAFGGSHRFIVDYLVEQVLNQQPPQIQQFLLETSVLERLSAPLCDALLKRGDLAGGEFGIGGPAAILPAPFPFPGGNQGALEYLDRANLFLEPLDEDRRWYRYHPLFAEFLRLRLRQSSPERWVELHHRAAQWFEANGYLAEAVDSALAVGEAAQALKLVEQIAEEIWMRGDMLRLLGWVEALPDEMIRSRPRLCIFHAWILNIVGSYEETEARLNQAEAGIEGLPDGQRQEQDLLRGMLATTRAILSVMNGDTPQARELCRQALALLPEQNVVWRSVVLRNLGNAYLLDGETSAASQAFIEAYQASWRMGNLYMALVSLFELAELQMLQGQFRQAERTCRQGLKLAAENTPARGLPVLVTGALHVGLSEVLYQWNDLDAAMRHALAGIELGQQGRSLGIQVCGYTRLAFLALARGDQEKADQAFQRAMQLTPVQRRTSFLAHHDIQGALWSRQGDLQAALHWAEANGLLAKGAPGGELNLLNEAGQIGTLRILLGLGRVDEALALSAVLRENAFHAGRHGRELEILTLQALAYQARGETEKALAALARAVELGEPQGMIRVFVDEGAPLARLLTGLKSRNSLPPRRQAYLQQLLEAFPEQDLLLEEEPAYRRLPLAGPLGGWVEPLSERELEVLRLIGAGLSNQKIAQHLVVAPSTVHWHVKNIYAKLSVHSRTQALARAGELGYL